jgi:NADH-quinone oxidoreductase subunit N
MNAEINLRDFMHLAPVLFVSLWGCLVLLASTLNRGSSRHLGPLSLVGIVMGIGVCVWSWVDHPNPATHMFGGMMLTDRFALFLDVVMLAAGGLTVLTAQSYLDEHELAQDEFFALLVLAIAGMMLMVHSGNFVMLLIGLETMSLAVYSLVACWDGKRVSAEAGIKYFIMGAVASAFLVYGIALIYGASGQTGLLAIAAAADGLAGNALFVLGMLMVLGAMAFKVALVPFHMWAPDAYEGAPTPVTGFMAAAVKAAGFGALLRVVSSAFGDEAFSFGSTGWTNVFWTLALLTMTVGNVAALRQHNIKRMLAYSSISHAGYLMIGVVAAPLAASLDYGAVLFYLLTYAVSTLGAFSVVAWVGRRDEERVSLDDWAGLAKDHPVVALAMTIFLLSLAGIPPTGGFFAKLYLFRVALDHPQLLILVIGAALNSVVALYYYLRPVVQMYFRDGASRPTPLATPALQIGLAISVVLVLALGLLPGSALDWAAASIIAR